MKEKGSIFFLTSVISGSFVLRRLPDFYCFCTKSNLCLFTLDPYLIFVVEFIFFLH